MEGLIFRRSSSSQKLSVHVKCSWKRVCICNKTAHFKIIITFTVDFYRCNNCINLKYDPPLELQKLLKSDGRSVIALLDKVNYRHIPKLMFYEIGKNAHRKNPSHVAIKSIAIFNNTCEATRSAIRTFCLYCIRYQREKVNRDVRRKICELIWMDKIKFLK